MKRDTRLLAGAIVSALILGVALFAGCASQTGLLSPSVERVCTTGMCYMRAPADVVDRRCRAGNTGTWDDGKPRMSNDGRRAVCCTVYSPWRKRFRVWVTEGEEECIVHEFCHIEQFTSPHPDHSKCDKFGLGLEKKRL